MATEELILDEIKEIPESLLAEVLGFIRFLKTKPAEGVVAAIASEFSLRKNWLRPGEYEVWADV